MHADDTNYTIMKNGVAVISGTGPAIRINGNRLVIRDGPQETPPLVLTRAEASRKLRHIVVCGRAGGFITFDALRWLRDTGVAFSQLDWDGAIIIASGPRGPDQPALRRAQVLVCSGVEPKAGVDIAREILRVKLRGQAEVARLLGSADTSAAIGSLAAAIARESHASKVVSLEAQAASIYWKLWEDMPVRFTRRNPRRLGPKGQWRPGRLDPWLTFGSRASQLTGKPLKATTPGNSCLNFLYAVLVSEMTIALLAVGLDPGIGLFHADVDGRSSLAYDAIEAVRPYVDCWLAAYLASTAFANRDFTEIPDGEIRLTHPLNSHLAYTAALWRKACEPVAHWLAQGFGRASGVNAVLTAENGVMLAPQHAPTILQREGRTLSPLQPPLPAFLAPSRGHHSAALWGRLTQDPVPRMCWECGRALTGRQVKFCSYDCVEAWQHAMRSAAPAEAALANDKFRREWEDARASKLVQAAAATRSWEQKRGLSSGRGRKGKTEREPLIRWYRATLQPHLVKLRPVEIQHALNMSRSFARHIIAGDFPHPRHLPGLARLAGVALPTGLLSPNPERRSLATSQGDQSRSTAA